MFGDGPTEIDCAVFGHVSQVKYHVPDVVKAKHLLDGIYGFNSLFHTFM